MPVKKTQKGLKKEQKLLEPLNTEIELQVKGTSHLGLGSYGFIVVGDKGFEYYNERTIADYIQIPWTEVEYIIASIYFGGRYIPRYAFRTKNNGDFAFSSKKPRAVLRACREHIPADKIVRSMTFGQVLKRNTIWLIDKIKGKK
ncbi:MAG: DUF956 family protein [Lachnospiraceae bacterium]|nr:DUF956 family protein [Lachnospiraceae bacterium]